MLEKQIKRYRRHKKVRARISGKAARPRLCIFRSAKHIYAQLIDDEKGKTLVAASDFELKKTKATKKLKSEEKKDELAVGNKAISFEVGKLIAKKAIEKDIKRVIFDRAGYKYFGRVKALAEGAREGGLEF